MLRRSLQILLCILTSLHLLVGHLGVLQVMAWSQMIGKYTHQKGLIEGVKETFDGEHPCSMCCKIVSARADEKQQDNVPPSKLEKMSKWFGLIESTSETSAPWRMACSSVSFPSLAQSTSQWRHEPPNPPPRRVA